MGQRALVAAGGVDLLAVPRIPAGAVGWRLDHVTAVGRLAVRER